VVNGTALAEDSMPPMDRIPAQRMASDKLNSFLITNLQNHDCSVAAVIEDLSPLTAAVFPLSNVLYKYSPFDRRLPLTNSRDAAASRPLRSVGWTDTSAAASDPAAATTAQALRFDDAPHRASSHLEIPYLSAGTDTSAAAPDLTTRAGG
jgi:hypothetical protein